MPEVDEIRNKRGHVIILEQASFRLEFLSLNQIDAAITYFEKPNITTRLPVNGDHWEFQSWISRLPAKINNAKNRTKILEGLHKAKTEFSNNPSYIPVASRSDA